MVIAQGILNGCWVTRWISHIYLAYNLVVWLNFEKKKIPCHWGQGWREGESSKKSANWSQISPRVCLPVTLQGIIAIHVLGELDKLKWTQKEWQSDKACKRCREGRARKSAEGEREEGQRGGWEPLAGGGMGQPMVLTCCGAHTSHNGGHLSQDTRRSSDTAHRTPQELWWARTAQWRRRSSQEPAEHLWFTAKIAVLKSSYHPRQRRSVEVLRAPATKKLWGAILESVAA